MVALGQQAAREEAEGHRPATAKGHCYYCVDPADIPQIFAMETASGRQRGNRRAAVLPQGGRRVGDAGQVETCTAPSLLGYVGTRPKPASQLILSSLEGDPLLIWWRTAWA